MITILTETGAYPVFDGEEWGRDPEGDVHVYDGQETLLTVDAESFVATLTDALSAGTQERLARKHLRSLSDSESNADPGTATVACGGDTTHQDDCDDAQAADHTATDADHNNDDTHSR
jgi:hypothetical protein